MALLFVFFLVFLSLTDFFKKSWNMCYSEGRTRQRRWEWQQARLKESTSVTSQNKYIVHKACPSPAWASALVMKHHDPFQLSPWDTLPPLYPLSSTPPASCLHPSALPLLFSDSEKGNAARGFWERFEAGRQLVTNERMSGRKMGRPRWLVFCYSRVRVDLSGSP